MKFKRCLILFLISAFISLSGCSKSVTDTESSSSENSVAIQKEVSDYPFEVILDKNALESLKDEKATIKIVSELEEWTFYVETENGKISNKTTNSFDYEHIKEDTVEDTIIIYFTDNKTAKKYEYTIPLIFAKAVNQEEISSKIGVNN